MFKRLVLFALIFCLPFQLGYHFWLPESFVKSFRIDYLSPTLYLTDLLILLFLALNYKEISRYLIRFISGPSGKLFLLLVLLNLWSSGFSLVSLFAWLRFIEYLLLFVALKETAGLARKMILPFSLSLGLIILLALLQFIFQSSLGGPLYLLGERPLSVAIPNIAKIYHSLPILPSPLLRPYATFSHPNSLAGYLLVSFVILNLIVKSRLFKLPLVLAILITFSEASLLGFVVIEVFEFSFLQSLLTSLILSLTPFLTQVWQFPAGLAQSFSDRHFFLLPTFKIITSDLLLGVGLKQYIPSLAAIIPNHQISYMTLQPVHNTFLLVIAELGLVGTLILIRVLYPFLSKLIKSGQTRPYFLDLTAIIFVTGALDHYWWTLPQNQLIIILALALITNRSDKSYLSN